MSSTKNYFYIIRSINASGKEKGLIIDFVDRWFGPMPQGKAFMPLKSIAGSIYAPDDKENLKLILSPSFRTAIHSP